MKKKIVWSCESMHSSEDECSYTVTRPATKLETGCWQLLYKLKPCETKQKRFRLRNVHKSHPSGKLVHHQHAVLITAVENNLLDTEELWVNIYPFAICGASRGRVKAACQGDRWDVVALRPPAGPPKWLQWKGWQLMEACQNSDFRLLSPGASQPARWLLWLRNCVCACVCVLTQGQLRDCSNIKMLRVRKKTVNHTDVQLQGTSQFSHCRSPQAVLRP